MDSYSQSRHLLMNFHHLKKTSNLHFQNRPMFIKFLKLYSLYILKKVFYVLILKDYISFIQEII